MKSCLKTLLISIAVICIMIAAVLFGLYIIIGCAFNGKNDKQCSYEILAENYEKHADEINEFPNYIYSLIDTSYIGHMVIEFDGKKKLKRFSYYTIQMDNHWEGGYAGGDQKIDSPEVETFLEKIGWTKETLEIVRKKTESVNGISFATGDPFTLGYGRQVMAIYQYKIFRMPTRADDIGKHDNACNLLQYRDNISFYYGSGAIGSICFPARDKELQEKNKEQQGDNSYLQPEKMATN